ncbi:MAG: hypothetical protein Q8M07_02670, partial [Prosthecobacter sp.]|nr:hypothetical protein [Prosthecobacter sp.]
MKKGLMGLLSLTLLVTLAGCGGGDTTEPGDMGDESAFDRRDSRHAGDDAAADMTEAQPAEGSDAVEMPAEPVMEEAAAPAVDAPAAEVPAGGDGLAGTKWTHNGISMEFKEG